jgi:7-cyano-7-deazaguanine synthase
MKVLVLVSGGVDSTTCLAMMVDKYGKENVEALSMYYGQKHNKELYCARKVAEYYGVSFMEIDLSVIFQYSNCSLLEHSTAEIPKESYAEQLKHTHNKPVSTYVPFRNGLFLSCAASVALSKDCQVIYYGAHSDDAAGNAYPDCSDVFNEAMNKAIYEGSGHQVEIKAPFVNMTKKDVVAAGLKLKVPYELTWSCYEGNEKACGVCGTCIDRKKAFELNGVKDPIDYEVY